MTIEERLEEMRNELEMMQNTFQANKKRKLLSMIIGIIVFLVLLFWAVSLRFSSTEMEKVIKKMHNELSSIHREFRTQCLVMENYQGKEYAQIGFTGISQSDPGLTLYDSQGRKRFSLFLDNFNIPSFQVFDSNGISRIELGLVFDPTILLLKSLGKQQSGKSNEMVEFKMCDENGRNRIRLEVPTNSSVFTTDNRGPSLYMYDNQSLKRIILNAPQMSSSSGNGPFLYMTDSEGMSHTFYGIISDKPYLQMTDSKGYIIWDIP